MYLYAASAIAAAVALAVAGVHGVASVVLLLVGAAVVTIYRAERGRGRAAVRRAQSLERVARDLAAETGPEAALLTAVSHQVAAAVRVARLHQEAQHAATTDELTGLPNRRMFFQRLDEALRESQTGTSPLTVTAVDVDLLKHVNDQLGHGAGDEALVRIGKLLSAGVRANDIVARLGGDEFGVLFIGAPILVAERIMRRLAETITRTALSQGGTLPSISWGLAEAATAPTVDAILDAADRAMYRHKRRARDRATLSAM